MSVEVVLAGLGVLAAGAGVLIAWHVARRGERRSVMSSARLLTAELKEAHDEIAFALDENLWDALLPDGPKLPSWEQACRDLAPIRPDAWEAVLEGVRAIELVAAVAPRHEVGDVIVPSQRGAPREADHFELTEARNEIREAIRALAAPARWNRDALSIEYERELEQRHGLG
jgi:hypothetical protein